MSHPKAYDPQEGYMFQLLVKSPNEREYEHLDYATDRADKKHLLTEYGLVYRGTGYTIKTITLPMKYWPKKQEG